LVDSADNASAPSKTNANLSLFYFHLPIFQNR
jgi:hypothetical protein